jgi:hypothetical protein
MRTDRGYVLIDWDTVAFAPPERDLWMLVDGDTTGPSAYSAASGHPVDETAADFFRRRWTLSDIAAYTDVLRRPHVLNADTAAQFQFLVANLEGWPAGNQLAVSASD